MASERPVEKVRITYTKSKDHRIVYADSALIGQSAARTITMDFFVGILLPLNETHALAENKKDFDIKYDTPDFQPYERQLQVQVVMTPESAEILINAISERLKIFKEPNQN